MDGNPNYNDGYYSPASGFQGENLGVWDGCVIAIDPGLGNTGATLWDHSGYHNRGTLTGTLSTHWTTDAHGTCLDFPDSSDLINIPYSDTFASKCYSWSIWVKSTEAGYNLGLISRWQNSGGTYSWVVTWENTGINWYQAGLTTLSAGGLNQNDGKWHHLAGVYDKVTTKLYLDGVAVYSVNNTGDYTATTQPLVLATYATTQDWDGKLRAFAFWNRPLAPGEVVALASEPGAMYRLRIQRFAAEVITVGVLAGSSAMAFSASAAVVGIGVISGSSAVSFAVTCDAIGIGVISGSSTVTFTESGDIEGVGVIAGAAAIAFADSGSVTGIGVVEGAATVIFAAVGDIAALAEIEGTAGISFAGEAAIVGVGVIAASSSITFAAVGDIAALAEIEGTAVIVFSASGDAIGIGALAGTSTIEWDATGEIFGVGQLDGTSQIGLSTTGVMIGVGVIGGSAAITFSATETIIIVMRTRCASVTAAPSRQATVVAAVSLAATVTLSAARSATVEAETC